MGKSIADEECNQSQDGRDATRPPEHLGKSPQRGALSLLILIIVGAGSHCPIPRRVVSYSGKLLACFGILTGGPGIIHVPDFAPSVGHGGLDDLLGHINTLGILGIPDIDAVLLTFLGDDVAPFLVALGAEDEHVTGLAQGNVHDAIAHATGCVRHIHTNEEHADDLLVSSVPDRLVSRVVPGVQHQSATVEGIALQDAGDDRARGAVRIYRRDISADSACAVLTHHAGADARHVPGVIHALEDRHFRSREVLHFIHDQRLNIRTHVLAQPIRAHEHLGHLNPGLLARDLILSVPTHRFRTQRNRSLFLQGLAGEVKAVIELPARLGFYSSAVIHNGLHQLAGFFIGLLIQHLGEYWSQPALLNAQHQGQNTDREEHRAEAQKHDLAPDLKGLFLV